jgi:peptidoglycan/xylan/chitin deacetylase (PgdA/CDA1 family)
LLRFLFPALAIALAASGAAAEPAKQPQYVLISFDGAQPIDQWKRSRAMAREAGAEFTYFLSCVYVLTRENRDVYDPPHHKRGGSNVGFAASQEDVGDRLRQIWTARAEGHEIANHGCGHFDGKDWSADDWGTEFAAFTDILTNAWSTNGVAHEPPSWRHFVRAEIKGFRAPYLSTGPGLFEALAGNGFTYDASGVSRGPAEPEAGDIVRFALPMVPEGPSSRPIIAMDYNLFVRHSGGIERDDKDGAFEERAFTAFKAAFDAEYEGGRVPLQIGLHFTLMNGGSYWRALERFVAEVCAVEDVRCVSYRTYLEETRGIHPAGDG